MTHPHYPRILDSVKANIADVIKTIFMMFAASYSFFLFESVLKQLRITASAFVFFLNDPILTSFLGGTSGHMIDCLQIRKVLDEQKNISIPIDILKYFVKILLSWFSILSVSKN